MRKLFALIAVFGMLLLPQALFAEGGWADASGLTTTADNSFGPGTPTSLPSFIGAYIIAPVFGIVGTIFFALTVYAGVLWMTAAGDPKKVDKAKDILVTSVIGTVIVVSAYVITNAVFSGLTEGSIT